MIAKSASEDHKFPEHIRKKRQASRLSYQDYLDNLGRADYDVRLEEGRQPVEAAGVSQAGPISCILSGHGPWTTS